METLWRFLCLINLPIFCRTWEFSNGWLLGLEQVFSMKATESTRTFELLRSRKKIAANAIYWSKNQNFFVINSFNNSWELFFKTKLTSTSVLNKKFNIETCKTILTHLNYSKLWKLINMYTFHKLFSNSI